MGMMWEVPDGSMLVQVTCERCGARVFQDSHLLAERDLARLTEHVSRCRSITTSDRPQPVPPLGELLRYFEIAIDFT